MVKGEELKRAYTLGSMYDHNNIGLEDSSGIKYRISADTILTILQKFNFTAEKARVHTYLYLDK